MSSSPIHDDFRFEYEQEQRRFLRRRVQWYAGVTIALSLIGIVVALVFRVAGAGADASSGMHAARSSQIYAFIGAAISIFAYGWVFVDAWRTDRPRAAQLNVLRWLLIVTASLGTVMSFLTTLLLVEQTDVGAGATGAMELLMVTLLFAGAQLWLILTTHFLACVFLPWTPRESLRPMYPVLAVTAGCLLAMAVIATLSPFRPRAMLYTVPAAVLLTIACGTALLPGMAVSWWKTNRFAREFLMQKLGRGYTDIRRELSGAQRIHESLFPQPEARGSIHFDYRYTPMRSIGGDYLYARFIDRAVLEDRRPGAVGEPQRELVVVLLDVCGHGISAALTVNRLHGEMERQLAEQPGVSPTELLRALNRFVYLTLSDHSMFVTAIAFRVSEVRSEIQYASAGHPPAFLRRADGRNEMLEPTAIVLGVARDLDVDVEDPRVPFNPGDTLIAYTDGAMESRNAHGRMLNIDGLAKLAEAPASPPDLGAGSHAGGKAPSLCARMMAAIDAHRFGPASDDTLIVEVSRAHGAATIWLPPTASFPSKGDTRSAAPLTRSAGA